MQTIVRANWWVDPKFVMRDLGIRKRLVNDDFQVLKKFPFGTLGWDYEEGLKFETTISKLGALTKWVRKYHQQHDIPFIFEEKINGVRQPWPAFQTIPCCSDDDYRAAMDEAAKKAEMIKHHEHDFIWILLGDSPEFFETPVAWPKTGERIVETLVFRPPETDVEGGVETTRDVELRKACNYCGKKYWYAQELGDLNHGACFNCTHLAMADYL